MKRIFLIVFILAGVTELLHGITDLGTIHFVGKSILLPSLVVYYYLSIKDNDGPVSGLLLLTLVLCWIGDVILMFQGDQFFVFGLIAFLLGHVTYIFVYRQHRNETSQEELRSIQRLRLAFPIVLAGTGLVVILYPHLGALQVPVMVYAIVITVMTINALFRYGKTNTTSFFMVFSGAILFMMSDSLLAIGKFIEPIYLSGFWIMLTYIGAQYLIVQGLIVHRKEK